MMLLHIKHYTEYTYSNNVFVEPQYLNFFPQNRPYIDIVSFELSIHPEPDGLFRLVNIDNNIQHQCWFNNLLDKFEIHAVTKVQTREFNPFGFFFDINHSGNDVKYKSIFLENDPLSKEIKKYLSPLRKMVKYDFLNPVNEILKLIHENWTHEVRYESDLHSPNECFEMKNGSCRDLSWMMIHMLRDLGIPSRFVSGYSFNPELGEGHELHAWVEFLIPGGGWIGVDPSAGIYTNQAYIPVACSHTPKNTLPVSGSFRGDANSILRTKVNIKSVIDN